MGAGVRCGVEEAEQVWKAKRWLPYLLCRVRPFQDLWRTVRLLRAAAVAWKLSATVGSGGQARRDRKKAQSDRASGQMAFLSKPLGILVIVRL
jgi:hypothetical protein